MLGTLATIHRNRDNVDLCRKILDLDERVLNRYKEMVEQVPKNRTAENLDCVDVLYFKFCRIRLNLWCQVGAVDATIVPIMRFAMLWELRQPAGYDSEYAWLVYFLRKKEKTSVVSKLTDEEILRMCNLYLKHIAENQALVKGAQTSYPDVALQMRQCTLARCARCDAEEKVLNVYKRCGGCLSVKYCSEQCQRDHWKSGHKEQCRKKQG